MPRFDPGDSVTYTVQNDPPIRDFGTVCRVYNATGFCCVNFEMLGCRRVHMDRLKPTEAPTPGCPPGCRARCKL